MTVVLGARNRESQACYGPEPSLVSLSLQVTQTRAGTLCSLSSGGPQIALLAGGGAWGGPLLTPGSPVSGHPALPSTWHCPHRGSTGLRGRVQGLVQTELGLFRPSRKNRDPPAHEPLRPRAGPGVAPHAQDRWLVSRAPNKLALFLRGDPSCLELRGNKGR